MIKARPTVYAGVMMRSRLEASFAQYLDKNRWNWEYEPLCFAGPAGQYLPDFRILFDDQPGSGIYVELKPTIEFAWADRNRMMPIRDTFPNSRLAVAAPWGDNRFGCFGILDGNEWERCKGYWPALPRRIPGPCQCGNQWIDPEFGRCEDCWKFHCSCGTALPPVDPGEVYNDGTPVEWPGPNSCTPCWEKALRESARAIERGDYG